MDNQAICELFAYNKWANQRVWDCVNALSEEQYHAPHDYSVGSMHQQIYHVLYTDWSSFRWMKAIMPDNNAKDYVTEEQCKTRADIQPKWSAIEQAIESI